MPVFGLITEGLTDQPVIVNILTGLFGVETEVMPFLPLGDETFRNQPPSFSNWELVPKYCSSPDFEAALPWLDYVVVQIDTDRSRRWNHCSRTLVSNAKDG